MFDTDKTSCESPLKRSRESIECEGSQSHENGDYITSSTRRSESENPVAVDEIPLKTSEWTEWHLSQINISIDCSTVSPFGVFTCGYTEFLKNNDIRALPEVIEEIYGPGNPQQQTKYECCKEYMDILSINADSIFDIHSDHIRALIVELQKPFCKTEFGKWMKKKKKPYLIAKDETMKNFITDTCRR
jgi:hypothetical protein